MNSLKLIENIYPFEENFTGSNYKSYKHRYFITYMEYKDTTNMNNYEATEVSQMEWKTYDDCLIAIRNYNLEKQNIKSFIITHLPPRNSFMTQEYNHRYVQVNGCFRAN